MLYGPGGAGAGIVEKEKKLPRAGNVRAGDELVRRQPVVGERQHRARSVGVRPDAVEQLHRAPARIDEQRRERVGLLRKGR